ncbi:MAG: type IV secretory system conjugative DNA transfer family protein [Bacteroidetes bacterium]|nr:type IV secretory system conjugative DNA transfer family protein [Bacteroidota bacterium]
MSLETWLSRDLIPSRMKERLYGWEAPQSLGVRSVITILVVFPVISLQVALAILTFIWGPPVADPLIPLSLSRTLLWSMIMAIAPWLLRPSARSLLIPLILSLFVISLSPLYSIHHVFLAMSRSLHHPELILIEIGALSMGGLMAALLTKAMIRHTSSQLSLAKGSTSWGTAKALRKPTRGLLLGKMDQEYLRYDGDGHLITIAATRSGKGVGTVMPNLLNYEGGMLVTDPKGENYAVTAQWRRDHLGQNIVALDPFGLMEAHAALLNPMDFINLNGDDYVETAMMLADMMIGRGHQVEESHWRMEAKGLLFSLVLHVAECDLFQDDRNLMTVRSLLTQDREELDETLKNMKESRLEQVIEGANRINQKSDRERSGVFSTAQSYTHFLTSPRMRKVITGTSCDLEDLRHAKMTVYIILPREYLSAFAPWLRLMISCSYYACTHNAADKPRPHQRVVFLLDEFANLGYMQNIKEAVSLGGGYGLSMWLILQDLAQLKREYQREWESFLANCDVIQTFAVQDPFTSQKITQLLGEKSIWQRRLNKGDGRHFERIRAGYEEGGRPLLKPDELRRLHPDRQLLLVRPYQPVVADKLRYYKDSLTVPRAMPNPFIG